MTIDNNLVELFNKLIYAWKSYEDTEYKNCSITGDKIIIDDSEEYFILVTHISQMVLTIRSELEDVWLLADLHFNSVTKRHIYEPLWEIYKHPITYRMTLKQIEHLIKTLNKLLSDI